MAESNLTVKNFSYCRPGFTKELPTRIWAGPNGGTSRASDFQVITEVFPKMANSCWKSVGVPVTINHFPVRRPARNGVIPPNCVPEKQDFKNQIFPMLLGERRCNLAFSRRIFLRHGVLAAAACASNPLMAFGARRTPIAGNEEGGTQRTPKTGSDNWQDHAAALDHLDRNAFSSAVGSSFKVFTGAGQLPVWLTLLAVEDLSAIAPVNPASFAVPNKRNGFAPTSSGFVLLFGGSSPVPQDTHLFEHQDLRRFALFTVPAGNGSQVHTAVVNRLDAAAVIAVPYSAGLGTKPASSGAPLAGGISAPDATSSTGEIPSRGLSGNPGVQRNAVRD
jgi:hypothetical protein